MFADVEGVTLVEEGVEVREEDDVEPANVELVVVFAVRGDANAVV